MTLPSKKNESASWSPGNSAGWAVSLVARLDVWDKSLGSFRPEIERVAGILNILGYECIPMKVNERWVFAITHPQQNERCWVPYVGIARSTVTELLREAYFALHVPWHKRFVGQLFVTFRGRQLSDKAWLGPAITDQIFQEVLNELDNVNSHIREALTVAFNHEWKFRVSIGSLQFTPQNNGQYGFRYNLFDKWEMFPMNAKVTPSEVNCLEPVPTELLAAMFEALSSDASPQKLSEYAFCEHPKLKQLILEHPNTPQRVRVLAAVHHV